MKRPDARDDAAARVMSRVCADGAHAVCGHQIVHMGPWGRRTYLETIQKVVTAAYLSMNWCRRRPPKCSIGCLGPRRLPLDAGASSAAFLTE